MEETKTDEITYPISEISHPKLRKDMIPRLLESYDDIFPGALAKYATTEEKLSHMVYYPDDTHWIYIDDGTNIIAFASINYFRSDVYLSNVGVIKKHQNKKIGSYLLEYITDKYKEKNIYLSIEVAKLSLTKFYEKFKFKQLTKEMKPKWLPNTDEYVYMGRTAGTNYEIMIDGLSAVTLV